MMLSRSLLLAFVATLVIQGVAFYLWLIKPSMETRQQHQPITFNKINEQPLGNIMLPKGLLAQLLVAADTPVMTLHSLTNSVAHYGCFQKLSIIQRHEQELTILYDLRKPMLLLGDNSNSCIADDGTIMGYYPFFTPKKLPSIYWGATETNETPHWNQRVAYPLWPALVFLTDELQKLARQWHMHLEIVDMGRRTPSATSTGEIVATLASTLGPVEQHKQLVLRLGLYGEGITNKLHELAKLNSYIDKWQQNGKKEPLIIDYRSNDFALLSQ